VLLLVLSGLLVLLVLLAMGLGLGEDLVVDEAFAVFTLSAAVPVVTPDFPSSALMIIRYFPAATPARDTSHPPPDLVSPVALFIKVQRKVTLSPSGSATPEILKLLFVYAVKLSPLPMTGLLFTTADATTGAVPTLKFFLTVTESPVESNTKSPAWYEPGGSCRVETLPVAFATSLRSGCVITAQMYASIVLPLAAADPDASNATVVVPELCA
jgi:hypothetical protein